MQHQADDPAQAERGRLVDELKRAGIRSEDVLAAIRRFPRHELVPAELRAEAYENRPLPIGSGQTISQPYIVAYTTEAAAVRQGARVLEVGTGSGYQAAILAEVGAEVYSVEILPELLERTRAALERLGVTRVHFRVGDGYRGWPEEAPFDAVVVTAGAPFVPPPLVAQLAEGGRLVIPVGPLERQDLETHEKSSGSLHLRATLPVRFVPMTGEAERVGSSH